MSAPANVTEQAELHAVVRQEMERWAVPGLALSILQAGILQDGESDVSAFGTTSIETGQPVTPATLFQIGSISKVFTATLIMQLVDEGHLDLDRPVTDVLPSLVLADAEALRQVTPRHLLSHTAGFFGDRFDDYGPGDDALSRAVAEFGALRQLTPPGSLWTYCNTGFQLLGAIIERLLETGYEAAMQERVLAPLGLDRSCFFAHEAITYSAAVGHNKFPEKELAVARPYPLPRCMNAAGAIIAPAGDLLRFAAFHLGDGMVAEKRILSEAALQAMQTPQTEAGSFAGHYGLGWALRTFNGTRVVGHGGSTNGFRAQLTLVPERRLALALLTNGSGGAAANHQIEAWWLQHQAGITLPEPARLSLPPERLARFAGYYEQPHAEITVTATDAGLQVAVLSKSPLTNETVAMPPMQTVAVGDHTFLVVDGESEGSTLDFILDEPAAERPRFIRLHGRLADRKDRG